MKKSNILFGLTVAMAAGFTACSDDDSFDKNYGKEAIAFSSYVNNCPSITAKTRAIGEKTAFSSETQIAMSIKSDKKVAATETTSSKTAVNTTAMVAAVESPASGSYSEVTFTNTEKRYWDDLFGREAQLTVYAVGVEGKKIADQKGTNKLELDTNNKIDWTLSTAQTATTTKSGTTTVGTYDLEDLLISNNVKKTDAADNRMIYSSTDGFPKGNLVFTHATTKITVNLIKGVGFGADEFTNPTITYNGFYNVAKYDVTNGTVDVSGQKTTDITPIAPAAAKVENSVTSFTYNALVVPLRDWDATDNLNVFTIETDDNTYVVKTEHFNSKSSLTNKLTGEMKAGNQYIFNITINKTGIEVTASLINWIPNNTALTPVIVKGDGIGHYFDKDEIGEFDLYRSLNVGSDYGTKECVCTGTKKDGYTMDKQIYWPNHDDAYYFRAISAYDENGNLIETDNRPTYAAAAEKVGNVYPEFITVKTCKAESSTTGAPMIKDGMDLMVGAPYEILAGTGGETGKPEEIGNLTPAKKAGDGDINFTFKHVMSQVYVKLNTTDGPDKVDLKNAKVEFINSYTEGLVSAEKNEISYSGDRTPNYSLGDDLDGEDKTGKVKLPGSDKEESGENVYRGYTVPQPLSGSSASDKVMIHITTSDGNTYKVEASTDEIKNWVSGNQYLYQLTLKKTGIVLTASLIDWKTGKVIDLSVKL